MASLLDEVTTQRPVSARLSGTQGVIDSLRHREPISPANFVFDSSMSFLRQAQDAEVTSDSASRSLRSLLASRIAHPREVEAIFWRKAADAIRVWTVIDQPNLDVENQIYDAELALMDLLPDLRFDFLVIFRQGKDTRQISPEGSTRIFSR